MIFYFSGTGNSKWVAEEIGERTGDQVLSIEKMREIPALDAEARIGLVFPIYAWGVPERMLAFARQLKGCGGFVFGVCTCGADAGMAMKKLSAVLPLDSSYSVVMPNNYIIGSDIEDEATIRAKIEAARMEIQTISEEIAQGKRVYRVHEGSKAWLKSNLINFGFNKFARTAKPFFATDRCNGCGRCEKNCPAGAIRLSNGKPVWKNACDQCMRCISECPQTAIQYGKDTENRGRYTLAKYLPDAQSRS